MREVRLGLVCYGGVSLAIYMHGVTKELYKLVRAARGFSALIRQMISTPRKMLSKLAESAARLGWHHDAGLLDGDLMSRLLYQARATASFPGAFPRSASTPSSKPSEASQEANRGTRRPRSATSAQQPEVLNGPDA